MLLLMKINNILKSIKYVLNVLILLDCCFFLVYPYICLDILTDSSDDVMSCEGKLIYLPLQHNSSMFLKCHNSGSLSFSNKNNVPGEGSHIALRKGSLGPTYFCLSF